MRPWQHARSSAGQRWIDDLPVHEFLDSTKASCSDRRHRIVLHHTDLGAEITARAFPERTDIAGIVRSHVREDLGRESDFGDWVTLIDPSRMPRPIPQRLRQGWEHIARIICARLSPSAQSEVVRFAGFNPVASDIVVTRSDEIVLILLMHLPERHS